jgi:hypothetical protein
MCGNETSPEDQFCFVYFAPPAGIESAASGAIAWFTRLDDTSRRYFFAITTSSGALSTMVA